MQEERKNTRTADLGSHLIGIDPDPVRRLPDHSDLWEYNHRFLFMVTCYFSIVLAVVLPEFLVAVTEKKKKTIGLTLIYLCLMVAAYIWKGMSMPYTAIFFAVYIGLWLLGTKNESGSQIKHTEILWLIPVCLEILCMAYLIYEPTQKNYIAKFEDAKTVNEKVEIRASAAFSAMEDSFRIPCRKSCGK